MSSTRRKGLGAIGRITGTTLSSSSLSLGLRSTGRALSTSSSLVGREDGFEETPLHPLLTRFRSEASEPLSTTLERALANSDFVSEAGRAVHDAGRQIEAGGRLWRQKRTASWARGHGYLVITSPQRLSEAARDFALAERWNMLRLKARIVFPNSYDIPLSLADRYEKAAAGAWSSYEGFRTWRLVVPPEDRDELQRTQTRNWQTRAPMSDGGRALGGQRLGANLVYPRYHLSIGDGRFVINSVLMDVSPEHAFRGRAGWFDVLDLETREHVSATVGAGRSIVPFVDFLNEEVAGSLWLVQHELTKVVLEDSALRTRVAVGQLDESFHATLLDRAGPKLAMRARILAFLDGFSFLSIGLNRNLPDTRFPTESQVKRASDFFDAQSGSGAEIEAVDPGEASALAAGSSVIEELPTFPDVDTESPASEESKEESGDILEAGGEEDGGEPTRDPSTTHSSSSTDPDGGEVTRPAGPADDRGEHGNDDSHEEDGREGRP
jgi:hypothetical protein